MATPGVRIEEIPRLPPSVVGVATAIPVFIGHTEKAVDIDGTALTGKARRISSLADYKQLFGTVDDQAMKVKLEFTQVGTGPKVYKTPGFDGPRPSLPEKGRLLYYSMQLYFANGGGPCYVLSVAKLTDALQDGSFTDAIKSLESLDEPTLIVFPDAALLSDANYKKVANQALAHCSKMQDRFAICDVRNAINPAKPEESVTLIRNNISNDIEERKYGALYYPYLHTDVPFEIDRANVSVKIQKLKQDGSNDGAASDKKLSDLEGTDSELYSIVDDFVRNNATVMLPPSSAIAGVYAKVDRTRGVWKAPANTSLKFVSKPAIDVTNDLNARLNVDATSGKSINVIRTFTGKGTLVWGARTLAGNDNEWRYIPVRRFYNFAEESIKKATEPFVFEPNDANTWVKVRSMIENFLTVQWRAGALAGAKPEDAFYVSVGLGQTMTADDILNGKMIVEIGMAVVRPAEFIILRFYHLMQKS